MHPLPLSRDDNTPLLLNRLRMRQVALLLAVDELGTLRAAANQIGMTQPAATKMLQELEDALGQTLFERVGRGLKLNPAGACVTGYFRGMRGSMEALNRELNALRLGSAGKLFIGSIMAASPAHLTEALIQLKTLYPLLAVEISVGTSDRLMEQLHEGVLDVVIGRVLGGSGHEFLFRPIADEALSVIVACDHPLARKRKVHFAELQAYPWILQPAGSPIETASILTTTNLIARTRMVAVIPASVARRYEQHGLLRILPYAVEQTLAAYGSIVHRDRPPSTAASRFLELLHQVRPLGA